MNTRLSFVSLAVAFAASAVSSAALAADLPARTYTKAPMFAPVTNWSGFYGGVNAGYGWGNNDVAISDVTPLSPGASGIANQSFGRNASGAFGGGQIGYNWQMGSFVTGLETDIQGSGIKSSATQNLAITDGIASTTIGSSEQKLSWFGTFRGRVGVTVTPDLLLYGTGGLAYGETSDSATVTRSFPGASTNTWTGPMTSSTRTGWAAGAGVEWMFARGWSAKAEYLHLDLGSSASATAQQVNSVGGLGAEFLAVRLHNGGTDTVRAGVNYHFN